MAVEEEAMWRRLLLVDILLHTLLRLTGMLLANSSANTAERQLLVFSQWHIGWWRDHNWYLCGCQEGSAAGW